LCRTAKTTLVGREPEASIVRSMFTWHTQSYFLLVNLPRDTKRILADSFSRRTQPVAA
jgi:hypothetical protein